MNKRLFLLGVVILMLFSNIAFALDDAQKSFVEEQSEENGSSGWAGWILSIIGSIISLVGKVLAPFLESAFNKFLDYMVVRAPASTGIPALHTISYAVAIGIIPLLFLTEYIITTIFGDEKGYTRIDGLYLLYHVIWAVIFVFLSPFIVSMTTDFVTFLIALFMSAGSGSLFQELVNTLVTIGIVTSFVGVISWSAVLLMFSIFAAAATVRLFVLYVGFSILPVLIILCASKYTRKIGLEGLKIITACVFMPLIWMIVFKVAVSIPEPIVKFAFVLISFPVNGVIFQKFAGLNGVALAIGAIMNFDRKKYQEFNPKTGRTETKSSILGGAGRAVKDFGSKHVVSPVKSWGKTQFNKKVTGSIKNTWSGMTAKPTKALALRESTFEDEDTKERVDTVLQGYDKSGPVSDNFRMRDSATPNNYEDGMKALFMLPNKLKNFSYNNKIKSMSSKQFGKYIEHIKAKHPREAKMVKSYALASGSNNSFENEMETATIKAKTIQQKIKPAAYKAMLSGYEHQEARKSFTKSNSRDEPILRGNNRQEIKTSVGNTISSEEPSTQKEKWQPEFLPYNKWIKSDLALSGKTPLSKKMANLKRQYISEGMSVEDAHNKVKKEIEKSHKK